MIRATLILLVATNRLMVSEIIDEGYLSLIAVYSPLFRATGFCSSVDTTCSAANTCRTCDTFAGMGGKCAEIDIFPNATVAEYGLVDFDEDVVEKIMTEM